MVFKLPLLFYFAVVFVTATAAYRGNVEARAVDDDSEPKEKRRLAAVLLKDEENGELRFLTGTGGNNNAALNQLITQKQNMLEQLRPNGGVGSGVFLTGAGTGLGTTGLGTTGLGTTGLGTGVFGGTTSGITPIVVNLGNTGTTTGTNAGLSAIATNTSPINNLLPQIIAQAVVNGNTRRQPINRRVVNRQVANRRRRRPNRNNQPKVVVLRP